MAKQQVLFDGLAVVVQYQNRVMIQLQKKGESSNEEISTLQSLIFCAYV